MIFWIGGRRFVGFERDAGFLRAFRDMYIPMHLCEMTAGVLVSLEYWYIWRTRQLWKMRACFFIWRF